jgi:L-cysteine S-thiosulfotransferase
MRVLFCESLFVANVRGTRRATQLSKSLLHSAIGGSGTILLIAVGLTLQPGKNALAREAGREGWSNRNMASAKQASHSIRAVWTTRLRTTRYWTRHFWTVRCLGLTLIGCMFGAVPAAADRGSDTVLPFIVVDAIPAPLGNARGDAARGRSLLVARDAANCVLCHAVTDPAVHYSGNVGPSLDGVARRLTAAQLRLRVVDILRVNPDSIMPGYYRSEGLDRVAVAYRAKPILDAGQVEDIVAYLATLR